MGVGPQVGAVLKGSSTFSCLPFRVVGGRGREVGVRRNVGAGTVEGEVELVLVVMESFLNAPPADPSPCDDNSSSRCIRMKSASDPCIHEF